VRFVFADGKLIGLQADARRCYTQEELAAVWGISRSAVWLAERSAIEKLKRKLAAAGVPASRLSDWTVSP
jgi:biotin operon repressor